MKKIFFLPAMLASVIASATVTVTPLRTDYATKKVTFSIAWTATPAAPYNDRVWIWIDFCPVNGVTPQSFSTATIASPVISGNGTVTESNERGFFIEYGATNTGTTVTAILSNAPAGQFNWCAYGSGYPPNIGDFNNGIYTLRGTPPFTLIDADDKTLTVTGTTIAQKDLTDLNFIPITMTDKTGCPSSFCRYAGRDLYMDATTYTCQQRTGGAENWEAWIKDTRDEEYYRIVLMPDNNWWLAQNVKLANYNNAPVGVDINGCTKEECGRVYTCAETYAQYAGGSYGSEGNVQGICPPGWLLPLRSVYATLVASFGSEPNACDALRPLNSKCNPKLDPYGWASVYAITNAIMDSQVIGCWYTNDQGREDGFAIDQHQTNGYRCGSVCITDPGECARAVVRCFRQL